MATSSPAKLRAFVRRHTQLAPVADVPGLRLHVADDVMALTGIVSRELNQPDITLPFWAFPWAGGLAIARHLIDHPDEVAGKGVLDLATGSGLCGIVAMKVGATSVEAADVDPLAEAAVAVNARANNVRIGFIDGDVLDGPLPAVDVILAGDVCYEEAMAARMLPWLRLASTRGTRVLIGDPGRRYLPNDLERVATYVVRTSRELESEATTEAGVYTFSPR
jgi:predicted nicotinamide N-methyase